METCMMHRLLRALSIQASTHQEGLLLRVLCTRVHRAMLTSMQRSLIMSTMSVWVRLAADAGVGHRGAGGSRSTS